MTNSILLLGSLVFCYSPDLSVEYGQRGIHTDNIHQFFVSPDGHCQFRVQLVEHDRSNFVFVCNRSQPPVFFPVLMPLYPTDGKQDKEYERTAYASPYIRILMPAIGNLLHNSLIELIALSERIACHSPGMRPCFCRTCSEACLSFSTWSLSVFCISSAVP